MNFGQTPPPITSQAFAGTSGETFDAAQVVVRTKPTWDGTWEIAPHLQCLSFNLTLAPSVSSAVFDYTFGNRSVENNPQFAILEALGLEGHYVKVELFDDGEPPATPVGVFVGQFLADDRRPRGVNPPSAEQSPEGRQLLTAYGLEHLLSKLPIDFAIVQDGPDTKQLMRSIPFNRRMKRGGAIEGNMDLISVPNVTGLQPAFVADGDKWTRKTIVQYLLYWFVTRHTEMDFELAQSPFGLLDDGELVEDFFGLTVADALNKIIDRRRGLVWRVVTDGETIAAAEVTTILDAAANVGSLTLPANPNQAQLDVDTDRKVIDFSVTKTATNKHRSVIVRGRLTRAICTLSIQDNTLDPDWTEDDKTAYSEATKNDPGYLVLGTAEQARRNDEFRTSDDSVNHVYRRFRVPDTFNWKVGLGDGSVSLTRIITPVTEPFFGFPLIPTAAEGPADTFFADKTLLRDLPIDTGIDYSVSPPVSINPDGAQPERAKPFAVAKSGPDGDHRILHTMGGVSSMSLPSVGLRVLDRGMGVEFTLPGNVPNHALALGTFTPVEVNPPDWISAEPSRFVPSVKNSIEYQHIMLTAAIELDQRPEMVLLLDPAGNQTALVIDFPELGLDYLVPGTVIGVRPDGSVRRAHADNAWVRDDTPVLRTLGLFIRHWYARPRNAVRLTWQSLEHMEPGTILTTVAIAGQQVQSNSIVSEVSFDLRQFQVTMQTDFVELDFAGLFASRGIASRQTGSTGSPSLGPIVPATRDLKGRVEKLEEALANLPTHLPNTNIGIEDAFIGVVDGYYEDRCDVLRMDYGDPEKWDERAFDSVLRCVWKGVGTATVPGDPVLCVKVSNSSKYLAMPAGGFNDVGDWPDGSGSPDPEFQFGEPDSVVEPGEGLSEPEPAFDPALFNDCEDAV